MFSHLFFGTGTEGGAEYLRLVTKAVCTLLQNLPDEAYSGCSVGKLRHLISEIETAHAGRDPEQVTGELAEVIRNSIALWHPRVVAHLHTPVLNVALAAEVVISALNQSMDSFDQAPAATVIEQQMVTWLARLCRLPATASGTFTAGGTQSNYMGLLLARDRFSERRLGWCTRQRGLPPGHHRFRILCSELSHFSVEKSAIQLGLGTDSVIRIPVDEQFRMCADSLRAVLADLRQGELEPFAIVATAGTTDFGSIDPLPDIASIAAAHGLWLHVDAAYGGALLLSQQRRFKLAGIELADSVTIDFHKAFFQPISCSAFLLADSDDFRFIQVHADYLNSEARQNEGIPDLVTNSVLTTRRFDALKIWVSIQALGQNEYGRLIDRLSELATFAAERLSGRKCFDVAHQPMFGTVVFRYVPDSAEVNSGLINATMPERLFARGEAVIGHTVIRGEAHLKLTMSNPCTSFNDVENLIQHIEKIGHEAVAEMFSPAVA